MRTRKFPRTWLALGASLAALLVFAGTAMAALGDRTLREGMSGDDVMELQRDVTYLGYPTPRTGTFTSETKSDIIYYERSTGLTVDGVVSQAEGRAIVRRTAEKRAREESGETRAYDFGERILRQGMQGGDVMTLQRLVTQLGYPTPRYGVFTSRTKADIIHYERSTGLTVDGVVSLAEQAAIKRRAGYGTPSSSRDHVFPIRGWHSYGGAGSRYGAPRSGHSHGGQDLAAASGTPLVAVTNGRVSQVRYQAGGAGYYLVIQGDDRFDYVYMHLRESASAFVAPGQRVRVGQQVGRVGSTGASSGPHLHFEMWTAHWFAGGHRFDPLPYLQRWDAYS
jgi:murein DD-endopeptidase MepM/ murein hydrolase activator NlpD